MIMILVNINSHPFYYRIQTMSSVKYPLAILAITLSTQAFAGPQCTVEPKEKWRDATQFEAELAKEYSIKKFKITTGNCYEIYAKDKTGANVEIYFNPVNGKIVKQE